MTNEHKHSHRELELLEALRRFGGHARNAELATALDVSEETVRRTIKSLSKSGTIARVHGGAYLAGPQSETSFFQRIAEHADEKRIIAKKVVRLVADGMSLFLDVGSTTSFVTEELRERHNLTVVTNSIKVAQTLVDRNNNRVFLLGGEMHSNELGAFGHVAERQARRYTFDLAILSADALNDKSGFLYRSAAEADLASVITELSETSLIAMVHHKFGSMAPHCGFHPSRIDRLITDQAPDKKLSAKLAEWGVRIKAAD